MSIVAYVEDDLIRISESGLLCEKNINSLSTGHDALHSPRDSYHGHIRESGVYVALTRRSSRTAMGTWDNDT